jgi:hypothetical protein
VNCSLIDATLPEKEQEQQPSAQEEAQATK